MSRDLLDACPGVNGWQVPVPVLRSHSPLVPKLSQLFTFQVYRVQSIWSLVVNLIQCLEILLRPKCQFHIGSNSFIMSRNILRCQEVLYQPEFVVASCALSFSHF